MPSYHGVEVVEPVEHFLRKIVCDVKLALYQRAINLLKQIEFYSAIEDTNSILMNYTYESPAELIDEIHNTLESRVRTAVEQYDIVTQAGNLSFLCDVLESLHVLDCYDDHETIVNLCHRSDTPLDNLFDILSLLKDFDEDEFHQYLKMCSMGLLDTIANLHQHAMDVQEAENIPPVDHQFEVLKAVVKGNRNLIISKLFADAKVTRQLDAPQITTIAAPYFDDYKYSNARDFAREMIGLFLLTGELEGELVKTIQTQLPYLCSDDAFIAQTIPFLGSVYTEMSHG